MSETIKGLDKLLKKLDGLERDLTERVAKTVLANGSEMAQKARQLAPYDNGDLQQSIIARRNIIPEKGIVSVDVVANSTGLAPYAAYQEFGTGGFVSVPPEMQEQAARFKSASSGAIPFIQTEEGPGRRISMRPQPYMYPALVLQRSQLLTDLERLLDKEMGRI